MEKTLKPSSLSKELKPEYATSNDIFYSTRYTYDFCDNVFPDWYKKCGYPNYVFHYHYHEFFEVLFMRKGKIRIIADFGKFTLRENEMLIVNTNEVYSGFFHEKAREFLDYSVILINLHVLANKTGADVRNVFKNLIIGKIKVKNHITPDMDNYDELREIVLQNSEHYINRNYNMPELMQIGSAISVLSELDECGLIYKTQKDPKTKEKDFSVRLLNYVQSHYRETDWTRELKLYLESKKLINKLIDEVVLGTRLGREQKKKILLSP